MVTMDTMAKGLLKLNLDMDTMVMVMDTILDMAMVTMDTMAKDLLKPSLDMDIMVMGMDMDMATDTMDTMARDLLRLSLAMDTMAMDMDMDTVMAMVMDIMDKRQPNLEFSTSEVGRNLSLVKVTLIHVEI